MHMTLNDVLDFSSAEVITEPFQYFVSSGAFSKDVSLMILDWLETEAPWKLVETDFYEQFEFSFLGVQLPKHLSFLQEQAFLNKLRDRVGRFFRVSLGNRIDLTAHKLVSGQRIRLHNDFIFGQETHRLLIQLNRRWNDEDGGFILFFNSSNPADIHKVFRPINNSVIGFAISPHSNHAVSTVHSGERFTLVYSFYGNGSNA
jgi:Rps23 Pro-64 3,4-dihydroxylase Tpa1-like proline 4-hydroxylase